MSLLRLLCLSLCCALLTAQAVAAEPDALSAGIALVGTTDYAAAAQTLAPLAVTHPDDSVILYWLGRAYYGERLFRLAAKSLGMAASRDPGNKDACLWHARALRGAGRATDAAQALASYCLRFPGDTTMLGEYAVTRARAGDYAGARDTFAQLARRAPSPATLADVAKWNATLDGLSTSAQLEPPLSRRTANFDVRYAAGDAAITQVCAEVERARKTISEALGMPVRDYRVLAFADEAAYLRYARIFLGDERELRSTAFTMPRLLVVLSPSAWRPGTNHSAEFSSTILHETAHVAIDLRTDGQGVPLWLNEGLACHFGGWGGTQSGQPPDPPLTLPALDQGFVSNDLARIEQAYAQAYAMATVLTAKIGKAGLPTLLDRLADGEPLSSAYARIAGEPFETFLKEWPGRVPPPIK